MSFIDDSAYLSSVAERVKSQHSTMERLMANVDTLMSRAKDAPAMQGIESMLSAIESTMAEMADSLNSARMTQALEALGACIERAAPVVNVPKQPTPVVNVNVSPTPITVEAVMPRQAAPIVTVNMPDNKKATWEVRIPGKYGAADRVMTIKRTD
jgi:hypothetical protein